MWGGQAAKMLKGFAWERESPSIRVACASVLHCVLFYISVLMDFSLSPGIGGFRK